MTPNYSDQGIRWIPVSNVSGEVIPSRGLMRVVDYDSELQAFTVDQPDADGAGDVLVNGAEVIDVDGRGHGHRSNDTIVAYDPEDGLPLNGEVWGAGAGTWLAKKDQPGFVVQGGALFGAVNVVRQSSGSAPTVKYLVRCESATAGSTTGVGVECYNATLIVPTAPDLVADFADGTSAWLTIVGMGGAVVPEAGRYYGVFIILGNVTVDTPGATEEDDPVPVARRRVFVQEVGGGSGGDKVVRATAAGAAVDCYIQADGGGGVLVDTGSPIPVKIYPSPPREVFEEDGYYDAVQVGTQWYAETGPPTKCIEIPDFATAYLNCDTGQITWGGFQQIRVIDIDCPPPPPPPPPP